MVEFEEELEDAKRGVRHRYNFPDDTDDLSISIMAFTELLVAECYKSVYEAMASNNKSLLRELRCAEDRLEERHKALLNEIQKLSSDKPARSAIAQLTSYAKAQARESVSSVAEEAKVDILNSAIAVMKETKRAMAVSLVAAVCTAAIFTAGVWVAV